METLEKLSEPIDNCPTATICFAIVIIGAIVAMVCILIIDEQNDKK